MQIFTGTVGLGDFDIVLAGTRRSGAYYQGGPLILNDGDEEDYGLVVDAGVTA